MSKGEKNKVTYKVLLVEDDEEDYILTREILRDAKLVSFDLTWVDRYEIGYKEALSRKYDAILVDYRLGRQNGLQLLKQLEEQKCTAPIILLTGAGDSEIDLQAMRAGASDYLVKGEIISSLLERSIRYSIERKKSQDEIKKLNTELENRVQQRTKELEKANKLLKKEVAERKLAQEQYYNLAYYDPLTKLPNRSMLNIRLHQAVEDARRTNLKVAVMFIDLDGFKQINDTLGHLAGDELLKEVANRLNKSVRESDVVCRHGGDEFIIVVSNLTDEGSAVLIAEKVLENLSKPVLIESKQAKVTPSIGISVYPIHSDDSEHLVKLADVAMYHSKQNGKNTYHFFKEEMTLHFQEK